MLEPDLWMYCVEPQPLPYIGVADCRRIVAERYNIRKEIMVGVTRAVRYALPRQMAMVLARENANASLPRIGVLFNRHHTTVMHACRRVTKREMLDDKFHRQMEVFRQMLRMLAAERLETRRRAELHAMYDALFPIPVDEPVELPEELVQEAA